MEYQCVTTDVALRAYLADAPVVAFDFETSPGPAFRVEARAALDAHRAEITGISLSVQEGSAIYVPLRHRQGENADPDSIMDLLRTRLFCNPDVVKIAHNLAFEAKFLYALGIVVQPPCYDTMAAAQMTLKSASEFRVLSDCGLKTLVPQLLGVDLPSFEAVTAGRHFDELDPQDAETIRYACADSDFALRLYRLFNRWFDRFLPRHRAIVEALESPTAVYCGLMAYNGVRMDRAAMEEKQAEAETRLRTLRAEIDGITGGVEIGANASTSAFKRYLYETLALPVVKTTARYQEAADDETMIRLREWCAANRPELCRLFDLIQEYRKWAKLKSTYLDGYLRHLSSVTGCIHPDYLPLGTETGRFAVRNPNLQNMPRKGSDPIGIRRLFRAAPGCRFLSVDFSQIELRVGAFYCRDDTMLETYRSGGDIHAQTTSVIYHIPFAQAVDKNAPDYKERRTIAKNCNFGVFYGLFPKGLQRTLHFKAGLETPLETCEQIIENLKRGYPGLSRWQDTVKRQAAARHYSETWLGRRRYLPGITSQDWAKRSFAERCALNTPIQGTAADILKLALGRLLQGLPERPWLRPLLQIRGRKRLYALCAAAWRPSRSRPLMYRSSPRPLPEKTLGIWRRWTDERKPTQRRGLFRPHGLCGHGPCRTGSPAAKGLFQKETGRGKMPQEQEVEATCAFQRN